MYIMEVLHINLNPATHKTAEVSGDVYSCASVMFKCLCHLACRQDQFFH